MRSVGEMTSDGSLVAAALLRQPCGGPAMKAGLLLAPTPLSRPFNLGERLLHLIQRHHSAQLPHDEEHTLRRPHLRGVRLPLSTYTHHHSRHDMEMSLATHPLYQHRNDASSLLR